MHLSGNMEWQDVPRWETHKQRNPMNHGNIRTFGKDGHLIHWGDAVTVLEEKVPDESVDLIFADPPYSIGKRFANFRDKWPSEAEYAKWCEIWLKLCIAKLRPAGSLYVMASTQCVPYLDLFLRERMYIASRIVWHYDSSGVQAKGHFGSMYEPILFCVKDKDNYTFNADAIKVKARTGAERNLIDYRKAKPSRYSTEKVPGNVWYFPRVRYRMHDTKTIPRKNRNRCWNVLYWRAVTLGTWFSTRSLERSQLLPSGNDCIGRPSVSIS